MEWEVFSVRAVRLGCQVAAGASGFAACAWLPTTSIVTISNPISVCLSCAIYWQTGGVT